MGNSISDFLTTVAIEPTTRQSACTAECSVCSSVVILAERLGYLDSACRPFSFFFSSPSTHSFFLPSFQGIRKSVIIGAVGTCLGAWVKTLSLSPDRYWITLLGQTIVACSQIFILNIPAQLAATWFGRAEVSTACSIGVFGNQVS